MRKSIVAPLMVLILTNPSLAATPQLPNANDFFNKLDKRLVESVNTTEIGNVLSGILWLIYQVGFGAATILLAYIAVQMIIAPPQKKSEVKAALVPYAIGVLLLVAGVPIATMIIEVLIQTF